MRDADDDEVMAAALSSEAVLITRDDGFVEKYERLIHAVVVAKAGRLGRPRRSLGHVDQVPTPV